MLNLQLNVAKMVGHDLHTLYQLYLAGLTYTISGSAILHADDSVPDLDFRVYTVNPIHCLLHCFSDNFSLCSDQTCSRLYGLRNNVLGPKGVSDSISETANAKNHLGA